MKHFNLFTLLVFSCITNLSAFDFNSNDNAFFQAVKKCDAYLVKKLATPTRVSLHDEYGNPVLKHAILACIKSPQAKQVLTTLLENNANPNEPIVRRSEKGLNTLTPLHSAASVAIKEGDFIALNTLLAHRGNPYYKGVYGRDLSPLEVAETLYINKATNYLNTKKTCEFLRRVQQPKIEDTYNINEAAQMCNKNSINKLLNTINYTPEEKNVALMYAITHCSESSQANEAISNLIRKGADPYSPDYQKNYSAQIPQGSILDWGIIYALHTGNIESLKALKNNIGSDIIKSKTDQIIDISNQFPAMRFDLANIIRVKQLFK